jgi:hypothetical protein
VPFSLDSGATLDPFQQRRSHEPDSSDPGCQEVIYEEVTSGEAERIRSTGAMISSSFVVWQDGPERRKGRFVVNLSKQSKHWPKGSVRMKTLPEYALELERGRRWCQSGSKRDTDTFGSLRR